MVDSLQYGFSQLTLLIFTTLSPSAACAFAIVGTTVLFSKQSESERVRLARFLIIPTAIALIGLIASTNHLGRPSNSLFVLTGIGRSPLSNEVAAVVVFVGLAWSFCMLSFSRSGTNAPLRILLGLACIAAIAHILFTGCAYEIVSIVTWYTPLTVLNQLLQAVQGGCMIAITTYISAGWCGRRGLFKVLLIVAFAASLASAAAQWFLIEQMDDLLSGLATASELVPFYPALAAASFTLSVLAIGVEAISLRKQDASRLLVALVSTVIMLMGIATIRFGFYCSYLTAGF